MADISKRLGIALSLTGSVNGKEPKVVDEVTSCHPGFGISLIFGMIKFTVGEDLADLVPGPGVCVNLVTVDGEITGMESVRVVEGNDPIDQSCLDNRSGPTHIAPATVIPTN